MGGTLSRRSYSCECRVLPLEYVPRALVNRDTRGFIKIVADSQTGLIVSLTAAAKDAGEIAAAGVYILEAGMAVDQVAARWSPYLTMAEGIKMPASPTELTSPNSPAAPSDARVRTSTVDSRTL